MARKLRVMMAVDPNIGTSKRSDFFVIATVGLDLYTMKLHILDIFRQRVPMHLQAQTVMDQYQKWRPVKVLVEALFWQAALVKECRKLRVPVKEVHRHKDKPTRLAGLAMRYSEGTLIHPEDSAGRRPPWLDVYEEEICSIGWEAGVQLHDHDDQADPVNDCCDELTYGGAHEAAEPQYHSISFDPKPEDKAKRWKDKMRQAKRQVMDEAYERSLRK